MKSIKASFIVCTALLVVCLLTIGAKAAGTYQSGIIMGHVEESSISGIWNVDVLSSSGERIEVLHTDRNGYFMTSLEWGNYLLIPTYYPPPPLPGHPEPLFAISGPPTPVKIGKFLTFVELPISIQLPTVD